MRRLNWALIILEFRFLRYRGEGITLAENQFEGLCKKIYILEYEANKIFTNIPLDCGLKDFDFFEKEREKRQLINLACNELSFFYVVAYLFKLYAERSNKNIRFVMGKFHLYDLDKTAFEHHLNETFALRTVISHFIRDTKKEDVQKQHICSTFYYNNTMKHYPENEDDWGKCLYKLMMDACTHLENLNICLKKLADEADADIIEEWTYTTYRYIPKEEMKAIARRIIITYDVPVSEIDFIDRNIGILSTRLQMRNFNSAKESREFLKGLVDDLLNSVEYLPPCPLRGNEIAELFHVKGRKIGEIKKIAMQIFSINPHIEKAKLVEKVRDAL